MKLWVDDARQAPEGYIWVRSVNDAMVQIMMAEERVDRYIKEQEVSKSDDPKCYNLRIKLRSVQLIDIDHDAGEYSNAGGDYINLLNWLEETGRNYPIRIHSMNPVGVQNMRAIIMKNGWKEII